MRSPHTAAVAGFLGLAVAMGVGRFAFTPILPLMQAQAGTTIAAGATLAAANYLGYLVGALAAMPLSGRPGVFIRAALVMTAAVTFGMGITHDLASWLALRFAAGFASAFLLVFISVWSLEHLAAAGRPRLSGVVFAGVGAGIAAVGAVCLMLENLRATYAHVWLVLGGLSLLLTLGLWPIFSPRDDPVRATSSDAHMSGGLTARWRLVLSYGLLGFGYIVPATFLPVMARGLLSQAHGFDLSWPVFGVAACLSTLAAARASSRFSVLNVWRTAQALMAIGVALPALVFAPFAVITAAVFVGGTFMVVTMAGMQSARRFGGSAPQRLMAAMTAAFATGQLVGPLPVPYLMRADGDFTIALAVAAMALMAGVFLLPTEPRLARAAGSAADVQQRTS
jgi:predicted MFS family arabinose efflux permease